MAFESYGAKASRIARTRSTDSLKAIKAVTLAPPDAHAPLPESRQALAAQMRDLASDPHLATAAAALRRKVECTVDELVELDGERQLTLGWLDRPPSAETMWRLQSSVFTASDVCELGSAFKPYETLARRTVAKAESMTFARSMPGRFKDAQDEYSRLGIDDSLRTAHSAHKGLKQLFRRADQQVMRLGIGDTRPADQADGYRGVPAPHPQRAQPVRVPGMATRTGVPRTGQSPALGDDASPISQTMSGLPSYRTLDDRPSAPSHDGGAASLPATRSAERRGLHVHFSPIAATAPTAPLPSAHDLPTLDGPSDAPTLDGPLLDVPGAMSPVEPAIEAAPQPTPPAVNERDAPKLRHVTHTYSDLRNDQVDSMRFYDDTGRLKRRVSVAGSRTSSMIAETSSIRTPSVVERPARRGQLSAFCKTSSLAELSGEKRSVENGAVQNRPRRRRTPYAIG